MQDAESIPVRDYRLVLGGISLQPNVPAPRRLVRAIKYKYNLVLYLCKYSGISLSC